MDLWRLTERLFGMTDEVWLRHASGWSVWTRVATLPFLLLAVWSHTSLGWWAILPVAAVIVWLWLNPRIFPPPRTTARWHAKATFGERLWLERGRIALPDRHRVVPHLLAAVAASGSLAAIAGAVANAIWPTLLGALLAYAGKLWFCDRMVWLYEDMKDGDPRWRLWLY